METATTLTHPTSISIFAGAGGAALGLHQAGFTTTLAVELDQQAAQTFKNNLNPTKIIAGDIKEVDFTPYYHQDIDLLEGGFPCQSFSMAGNRKGTKDTRGTLFHEYARAVAESMPKVFIAENVRGLLLHDRGETFDTIINTFRSIKDSLGRHYTVSYQLMNAAFHGVPQVRERFIIVGVRSDITVPFTFPQPTEKPLTLRESKALENPPESNSPTYPEYKASLFSLVPEGGHWRSIPRDLAQEYINVPDLRKIGGATGILRRLDRNQPSLTILTSPAQKRTERCHPTETRPLTIRESARIQSFPDWFQFYGSISSQYKQVGNAVPPELSRRLALQVLQILSTPHPFVGTHPSFKFT